MQMWADSTLWGTVGVTEALTRIPRMVSLYWKIRQRMVRERPDLVVVIDAPAIHMRLAGIARRHGLRTIYYFPPSAWTNNPRRLRRIHSEVAAVVAAFSYSAGNYRKLGLPIAYFGHPLVDLCRPEPRESCLEKLGLPDGDYVALLPGSRTQEIRTLTPVFLQTVECVRRLDPRWTFLIPAANPQIEALLRDAMPPDVPGIRIVSGRSREVMRVARAGLLASGSATLEAALLDLPHLLCYRINPTDELLFRFLMRLGVLKLPYIGLPNLVLNEGAMPEILQDQVSADNLARRLLDLLHDGPERDRCVSTLERVRQALGPPGAIERVATFVERMAIGASREEALYGL